MDIESIISILADLASIGAFLAPICCYIYDKCKQRKNHSSEDK